MTTRKDVDKVFREFRKAGYFAKQDFHCCRTCGWSAVPDKSLGKAVFYNNQDARSFYNGILEVPLHLSWSGDGKEICAIIKKCGLKVSWDGDEYTRIEILP